MDWRCYFRHRWGAWGEPTKHHVYLNLLGGTNVQIFSEVKPGPFDLDLGEYELQARSCERCKIQQQRRV